MYLLLPVVLAANQSVIDKFADAMNDCNSHRLFPEWMTSPWQAHMNSIPEITDEMIAKSERTKLISSINIVSGPVPDIKSYLTREVAKIDHAVQHCRTVVPDSERDSWKQGLLAKLSHIQMQTPKFFEVIAQVIRKTNSSMIVPAWSPVTGLAILGGWMDRKEDCFTNVPQSLCFPQDYDQVVGASYLGLTSSRLDAMDLSMALLIQSSQEVLGASREDDQLITNLLMMRQSGWMLKNHLQAELISALELAPIGHRVVLKIPLFLSIVDLKRHTDGKWYGVKYGQDAQAARVFCLPHEQLALFISTVSSSFRFPAGITFYDIDVPWYQGGRDLDSMVKSYTAAWGLGDKLAVGAIWDAVKTDLKLSTNINLEALISQISPSSATALAAKLTSLDIAHDEAIYKVIAELMQKSNQL